MATGTAASATQSRPIRNPLLSASSGSGERCRARVRSEAPARVLERRLNPLDQSDGTPAFGGRVDHTADTHG
jgi:hypothetical protein